MDIRHLVPAPIRASIRQWQRDTLFRKSLNRIRVIGPDPSTLESLCRGWGNEGWSADTLYLQRVWDLAVNTRGTILECGSGITTFLLGMLAGKRVWSLEHIPQWAEKVNAALAAQGLENRVRTVKLINYGDFDWYEVPVDAPTDISLVICDGPPSTTRGGRSGLLPVLHGHLAPNAIVLMDDAEREDERRIIQQWSTKYSLRIDTQSSGSGEVATLTVSTP